MSISAKRGWLLAAAFAAAVVLRGGVAAASDVVCTDLNMVWHDPATGAVLRSDPYACGSDLCGGYRCKSGNEISPACYSAAECPAACGGECVYIPTAQLDCTSLCTPGSGSGGGGGEPCEVLMTWYKRGKLVRSEPYQCAADACAGYRCLDDGEISPACYTASQCAKSCRGGACVEIPALQATGDCAAELCSLE